MLELTEGEVHTVSERDFIIEAIDDPVRAEPIRRQIERGQRNMEWLSANWALVLPQARGRFVAVAGQEAHVANSPGEAWAWARTAHPEDDGAMVQYVRLEQGPRNYSHHVHLQAS